MSRILECIPNFSVGQDQKVIDQIAASIIAVPHVHLLHIDTGYAANRTVMTFAGEPAAVIEAAYQAIKVAAQQIDMRKHVGTHPRMGATDVCPLVPIEGLSMQEADRYAHQLAERCGALGINIYMYESSARADYRRDLSHIRSGEYEGLAKKMRQDKWKPDYGPSILNTQSGATVIGARDYMIAYNINLTIKSASLAHEIAKDIRASGRKVIDSRTGNKQTIPGRCAGVKAIGWYIDDYEIAQVSMNIVDHHTSPLHSVYEACKELAAARDCSITGSELIGLVPLDALLDAGRYYAEKAMNADNLSEAQLLDIAIDKLGLSDLAPFDAQERVIEYCLASRTKVSR